MKLHGLHTLSMLRDGCPVSSPKIKGNIFAMHPEELKIILIGRLIKFCYKKSRVKKERTKEHNNRAPSR